MIEKNDFCYWSRDRKKSRVPLDESRQNKSKEDDKDDDVHDIMSQYLENQQPNTSGKSL